MQFDYQQAIKDGATSQQIQAYLAANPNLKSVGAPTAQDVSQTTAPQQGSGGSFDYQKAISDGVHPLLIKSYLTQNPGVKVVNAPNGWDSGLTQNNVLPNQTQVTQNFGNYNPSLEVFSQGYARDTNFATNSNTPVAAPPGTWQVINAYNQANPNGRPGDGSNQGYGNAVMLQNKDTGEKLHFIHLAQVGVNPGDTVKGNTVVGLTGMSGNATGPNLGVEYYDPNGNMGDVLKSVYANYFPTGGNQ